MFSGAGEFFRPVELRRDLPPLSSAQPVGKTGDENRRDQDAFRRALMPADDVSLQSGDVPADAAAFGPDFIELSLTALQAMLSGGKTAHAYGRPPVQAAPQTEPALAAYRRAADISPHVDAQPDQWRAAAAHHPAADAGSEIFYMLAALEKAGIGSITVNDGQTIYAALRLRCLETGLPLDAPAVPSAGA